MRLAEAARVATTAARLEEATFALLGGWVPTVPEPAARALLAEQSLHHAWHASLWRDRVPVAAGLVPAEGDGAPAALDDLLAITGSVAAAGLEGTVERLAAAHLVLADPRLAAYRALLDGASAASDGPVVRALELILADQERDRRAGAGLLAALAGGTDPVVLRAAVASRLPGPPGPAGAPDVPGGRTGPE
jgi:hypothetical protein